MKRLLKALISGAACGLSALAALASVAGLAATLSIFTGPTGSNPLLRPDLVPDFNTLVNSTNLNAGFAGTIPPSQVIGTIQQLFKGTGLQTSTIQLFGPFTTTTNGTGAAATCSITQVGVCFGVYDSNGVLRWIGAN